MTRRQIDEAFEIEFREPPEYALDLNQVKWTGHLLLGGEPTGIAATQAVSRFEYVDLVAIKAEIMRHAIREFTRRWRVAADAEAELEAVKGRLAELESKVSRLAALTLPASRPLRGSW